MISFARGGNLKADPLADGANSLLRREGFFVSLAGFVRPSYGGGEKYRPTQHAFESFGVRVTVGDDLGPRRTNSSSLSTQGNRIWLRRRLNC
jgi:hypothetical protein